MCTTYRLYRAGLLDRETAWTRTRMLDLIRGALYDTDIAEKIEKFEREAQPPGRAATAGWTP
jgi:hypothetical protein